MDNPDSIGFKYGAEWLYRYNEINHSYYQYDDPYAIFVGGFIYRIFGLQPIVTQYLNVLMGLAVIFLVVSALEKLDVCEATIEKTALLMAIFPFSALYSVQFLREAIVQLFLALSMYMFVCAWKDGKLFDAVWSVIFAMSAGAFHVSGVVAAGMVILHLVFFDRTAGKYHFSRKGLWMMPVFAIAFAGVCLVAREQLFFKIGSNFSLQTFFDVAENRVKGGSAYDIGIFTGNNIVDFIINTPLRMFYFLCSPMPWDWRGPVDMAAFLVSSGLYICAFASFFRMLWVVREENWTKQLIIILFVVTAALIFVFAWGTSNAGTAIRHRDKMFAPCMVILAVSCEMITTRTHGLLGKLRCKKPEA